MPSQKTGSAIVEDRRISVKIIALANELDTLQKQLKILRRREKLLKGSER
jgi:hypothetical protein